MYSSYIAFPGQ